MQVGSDLPRTGTFASSHELLNTFHENVVRGMQGNFLSVPTDCPQRDERLGWTGDIAAFAPTASYLFDTRAFLGDWLRDVWLEQQHADGVIPFVVPDVLKYSPAEDFGTPDATAVWSDAGVWVPWTLYQAYGDTAVLEEQFPSMAAHLRRIRDHLSPEDLWDTVFQFGDWLDPDAPPEDPAAAKADKGVVATICAYRSATIAADAAELLGGHEAEASEFRELASRLQAGFRTHYLQDDGRILSDCTTVYTLAIVFGILTEQERASAGDRLSALVERSGYRISTGFAGTPFITDALTQTGHVDDAYRLLLQTECPSWLYPVTMGATTVWERWDSMLPDGTINPGQMTSFNHYALGAVADWMHRVVGGLAPLEPGYASVLVAPQPGGGLTWRRPRSTRCTGTSRCGGSSSTGSSSCGSRCRRASRPWSGCRASKTSGCRRARTSCVRPLPCRPRSDGHGARRSRSAPCRTTFPTSNQPHRPVRCRNRGSSLTAACANPAQAVPYETIQSATRKCTMTSTPTFAGIADQLARQAIELPSWAFGNSGTRFKVFGTRAPRATPTRRSPTPHQVHRYTGLAPTVALHIPWDLVDDFADLKRHAEEHGVALGTVNSNTFQDDDYKFGALTHVDETIRQKAIDHHLRCIDVMDATAAAT